jgi:peptide/nickel transport system ATP-binding protein
MSEAYFDGPLLSVKGLTVEYGSKPRPTIAVDGVDLDVERGEFLGIVGESGCGKSTLLFAIAQLLNPPARVVAGSVEFKGQNLVELGAKELRAVRWKGFSVVMQSAMNALNPVLSVAAQLRDVCEAHSEMTRSEVADRSADVLRLVGIDPVHLDSYPHQLSGGMRQRVMIAMALIFTPDLVIMDEPTSALDVVAQRSLMVQTKELQRELGFAVVFVTHDMSLVSHFSDRMAVMYAGQISELGRTRDLFDAPLHPYSRGLLDAFPSIRGPRIELTGIPGSPPDLSRPKVGCRFKERCPRAIDRCTVVEPELLTLDDRQVRCILYAGSRLLPADERAVAHG